jgi:threonine/homoserine/homoserine lactone efflux protein
MNDLLPPWPLLSAFLLASLVLAVTPGPGVFYIVTRSLMQGHRFGLTSVAGVALGNLGNALAASIGLAALFAVSSLAFASVKYAGALYLVYLGIHALRAPQTVLLPVAPVPAPLARVFRDGFIVAMLNPKTTLFFAAFLPQFVNTEAAPMVQSIIFSGRSSSPSRQSPTALTPSPQGPSLPCLRRHVVFVLSDVTSPLVRSSGSECLPLWRVRAMGSRLNPIDPGDAAR